MGAASYREQVDRLTRKIASAQSTIYALEESVHGMYQTGRRDHQRQQRHRLGIELKPGWGKPVVIRRPPPPGWSGG
jgi:hypothetical protein